MGIIVLGMHRSGTSVLARFLGLMVGYEGRRGAARDNEEGHWEDPRMNYELEAALRRQNADWASPPLEGLKFLQGSAPGSADAIIRVISKYLKSPSEWVLKDPRLCLCASHVAAAAPGATLVATFRSPVEVASSLAKRDQYTYEYGLALWEAYNRQLVIELQEFRDRTIWVSYEQVMEDPRALAESLRSMLEGRKHKLVPGGVEAAVETINPRLRHQQGAGEFEGMSPQQQRLYNLLNYAVSSGTCPSLEELPDMTSTGRALIETRRPYARMERDNRLLRHRLRALRPVFRTIDAMRRRLNLRVPEDPFGN